MEILLKNTEEELRSLPINSSVTLISNKRLEEDAIKSSISIFRLIGEQGLFNFGDSYNQSIGYIREEFKTIDYNITISEVNGKYETVLKPLVPLHPNSNYGLFIDKSLNTRSILTSKINSKSSSSIKVEQTTNSSILKTIIIEVLSDPLITDKANMLSVKYTDDNYISNYTLNLKSTSNFIVYDGIKTIFQNIPYLKGETFITNIEIDEALSSNFIKLIKTTMSGSVIQTEEDSKGISENDILEYYKNKDKEVQEISIEISPEWYVTASFHYKYLGYNKILLKITDENLVVDDLDLDTFNMSVSEAFDIYTLEQYGYYDPTKEYRLSTQLRNDKEFVLIVEEIE